MAVAGGAAIGAAVVAGAGAGTGIGAGGAVTVLVGDVTAADIAAAGLVNVLKSVLMW